MKKIFVGIAILAITAVAAFNVNMNTQKSELSDLSLANVEALAQESGGEIKYLIMRLDCFNSKGVVIGSRIACYAGGGSKTCKSTSC
jgi:hypothetical protein